MAATALLLVPYLPSPVEAASLTTGLALRSSYRVANAARWTRAKGLASLVEFAAPPALPPAPGSALPWEPGFGVYKGQADLATGNLLLTQPVTSWPALGPGVSLTFAYNSEGTRRNLCLIFSRGGCKVLAERCALIKHRQLREICETAYVNLCLGD